MRIVILLNSLHLGDSGGVQFKEMGVYTKNLI